MKTTPATRLRPTLWDEIGHTDARNIYCRQADFTNEASVETFFINRLLKDLGYADSQIKTKQSLQKITVGRGRKKEKYKPDYALVVNGIPRCIVDAKGPDETLDDWTEQCSGYCLALNQKYPHKDNPVRFFILSNGIITNVYLWDSDVPVLALSFADFDWGNLKLEQLKALVGASTIMDGAASATAPLLDFQFTRPTSEWARNLFSMCHRVIWKSGYGKQAAFMEFVKIMFLKLWADRGLRENPATKDILANGKDSVKLPRSAVIFSESWIKHREAEGVANPLDTILFERLRTEIEQHIQLRKKKRLFDHDERIGLRADVVKDVVARLQHYDMYGIDEDLNGRLFETFLSATMRGKELGPLQSKLAEDRARRC